MRHSSYNGSINHLVLRQLERCSHSSLKSFMSHGQPSTSFFNRIVSHPPLVSLSSCRLMHTESNTHSLCTINISSNNNTSALSSRIHLQQELDNEHSLSPPHAVYEWDENDEESNEFSSYGVNNNYYNNREEERMNGSDEKMLMVVEDAGYLQPLDVSWADIQQQLQSFIATSLFDSKSAEAGRRFLGNYDILKNLTMLGEGFELMYLLVRLSYPKEAALVKNLADWLEEKGDEVGKEHVMDVGRYTLFQSKEVVYWNECLMQKMWYMKRVRAICNKSLEESNSDFSVADIILLLRSFRLGWASEQFMTSKGEASSDLLEERRLLCLDLYKCLWLEMKSQITNNFNLFSCKADAVKTPIFPSNELGNILLHAVNMGSYAEVSIITPLLLPCLYQATSTDVFLYLNTLVDSGCKLTYFVLECSETEKKKNGGFFATVAGSIVKIIFSDKNSAVITVVNALCDALFKEYYQQKMKGDFHQLRERNQREPFINDNNNINNTKPHDGSINNTSEINNINMTAARYCAMLFKALPSFELPRQHLWVTQDLLFQLLSYPISEQATLAEIIRNADECRNTTSAIVDIFYVTHFIKLLLKMTQYKIIGQHDATCTAEGGAVPLAREFKEPVRRLLKLLWELVEDELAKTRDNNDNTFLRTLVEVTDLLVVYDENYLQLVTDLHCRLVEKDGNAGCVDRCCEAKVYANDTFAWNVTRALADIVIKYVMENVKRCLPSEEEERMEDIPAKEALRRLEVLSLCSQITNKLGYTLLADELTQYCETYVTKMIDTTPIAQPHSVRDLDPHVEPLKRLLGDDLEIQGLDSDGEMTKQEGNSRNILLALPLSVSLDLLNMLVIPGEPPETLLFACVESCLYHRDLLDCRSIISLFHLLGYGRKKAISVIEKLALSAQKGKTPKENIPVLHAYYSRISFEQLLGFLMMHVQLKRAYMVSGKTAQDTELSVSSLTIKGIAIILLTICIAKVPLITGAQECLANQLSTVGVTGNGDEITSLLLFLHQYELQNTFLATKLGGCLSATIPRMSPDECVRLMAIIAEVNFRDRVLIKAVGIRLRENASAVTPYHLTSFAMSLREMGFARKFQENALDSLVMGIDYLNQNDAVFLLSFLTPEQQHELFENCVLKKKEANGIENVEGISAHLSAESLLALYGAGCEINIGTRTHSVEIKITPRQRRVIMDLLKQKGISSSAQFMDVRCSALCRSLIETCQCQCIINAINKKMKVIMSHTERVKIEKVALEWNDKLKLTQDDLFFLVSSMRPHLEHVNRSHLVAILSTTIRCFRKTVLEENETFHWGPQEMAVFCNSAGRNFQETEDEGSIMSDRTCESIEGAKLDLPLSFYRFFNRIIFMYVDLLTPMQTIAALEIYKQSRIMDMDIVMRLFKRLRSRLYPILDSAFHIRRCLELCNFYGKSWSCDVQDSIFKFSGFRMRKPFDEYEQVNLPRYARGTGIIVNSGIISRKYKPTK